MTSALHFYFNLGRCFMLLARALVRCCRYRCHSYLPFELVCYNRGLTNRRDRRNRAESPSSVPYYRSPAMTCKIDDIAAICLQPSPDPGDHVAITRDSGDLNLGWAARIRT